MHVFEYDSNRYVCACVCLCRVHADILKIAGLCSIFEWCWDHFLPFSAFIVFPVCILCILGYTLYLLHIHTLVYIQRGICFTLVFLYAFLLAPICATYRVVIEYADFLCVTFNSSQQCQIYIPCSSKWKQENGNEQIS